VTDLTEIYNQYGTTVFKFLMSMTHNESLAEELTEETFYRAYMNMNSFRGECKISVWLCQIAKMLYYSWYNSNKKLISLDEVRDTASDEYFLDINDKILSKDIIKIIYTLEEPYQKVFMLHVLEQVPLNEISTLYGKSESWARVTFYRSKSIIRDKMEGENK